MQNKPQVVLHAMSTVIMKNCKAVVELKKQTNNKPKNLNQGLE